MFTIEDINENDICINFGCESQCRKCTLMYNTGCVNYESNNTRQAILNKLYNDI